MADPVSALPEESRDVPTRPPGPALGLLRRHDFRSLFLAISASELGDSLHYIASSPLRASAWPSSAPAPRRRLPASPTHRSGARAPPSGVDEVSRNRHALGTDRRAESR